MIEICHILEDQDYLNQEDALPDAQNEAGLSFGHLLLKTSFVVWWKSLRRHHSIRPLIMYAK